MKDYILVIDSGIGGLCVLNWCKQLLPKENFIYFSDLKNLPYGNKSKQRLKVELEKIVSDMIKKFDIKAVVIACNTATAAGIEHLRDKFKLLFIGTEPAIKMPLKNTIGSVCVLATEATLKYSDLLKNYVNNKDVKLNTIKNFAQFVDDNIYNDKKIEDYLLNNLNCFGYDNYVLACTHYALVKPIFEKILKNCGIYEGSYFVALHLKKMLTNLGFLNNCNNGIDGTIKYLTSTNNLKYQRKLKNIMKNKLQN